MHRERGVALLICMLILLIISVMGISALRLSMSQTQIAASTIASNLGFHAAETGINKVIADVALNGRGFLPTSATAVFRCVADDQVSTSASSDGSCPTMDSKGIASASVRIELIDAADEGDPDAEKAALGERVDAGGGPGFVMKKFRLTSTGRVDAMDIQTVNVQEAILPYREL